MVDDDGYGYSPLDRGPQRLIQDMRTLSPAGLARVAEGWDAHVGGPGSAHEAFHAAQREALAVVEKNDEGAAWEDLQRRLLELTEGPAAMIDWKAEHGAVGHKAEQAALAAALALMAERDIGAEVYGRLVRPMAEAVPWLRQA